MQSKNGIHLIEKRDLIDMLAQFDDRDKIAVRTNSGTSLFVTKVQRAVIDCNSTQIPVAAIFVTQ